MSIRRTMHIAAIATVLGLAACGGGAGSASRSGTPPPSVGSLSTSASPTNVPSKPQRTEGSEDPPEAKEANASPATPAFREAVADPNDRWYYLCLADLDELSTLRDRDANSDDVTLLQSLLTDLGYQPGPVDGVYGSITKEAVREYQRYHGLIVDGITGPQTWGSLQVNDLCDEIRREVSAWDDGQDTDIQDPVQDQVPVPGFVGLGNQTADSVAMRSGVTLLRTYTNTDPSLRAQALNECRVVDQSPVAGSVIARQGTVRVLIDCPLTGYDAPAPPEPWSG